MTGRLLSLLFCLIVPCMGRAGDTGTYKIDDYKVRLTPHSDGNVTIEYYQKWLVTGGHIPWITVGVPNSNFTIRNGKGAAKNISSASEGGWSGVRVDLDRDYRPGESFQVWFSIEQSGVFHATDGEFKLDFIPGWYDHAVIGQLTVTMHVASKIGDVKASPQPTSVEGQEITWVRKNLGQGQQIQVSIAFPKVYMPGVKATEPGPSHEMPDWFPLILFACLFMLFWFLSRVFRGSVGSRGYSGGSIFFGGLGGGGGSGRSSSGGGGFGGSSSSCACACVSCACACACAGGGGGAGCSKKTTHSCPLCRGRRT